MKSKPKRTDLGYLVGWFLPETKGNHREAKRLAKQYRQTHVQYGIISLPPMENTLTKGKMK